MSFTRITFALICLGLCRTSVSAQTTTQQATNAALLSTNSCNDLFGTRVSLRFVPDSENALLLNGSPAILLDENVINHAPIQFAEFLYFSECGHHVLGHVLKAAGGEPPAPTDGFDADCWALRLLQHSAGYGVSDTAIIIAGLSRLYVSGYPYVQGVARAHNLSRCP